jgi:hypothetical protein
MFLGAQVAVFTVPQINQTDHYGDLCATWRMHMHGAETDARAGLSS